MSIFFRSLFLFLLLFVFSLPLFANSTKCIGQEKARLGIIYLHGLMNKDKKTSHHEQVNFKTLAKLAEKESVRIAFPISSWWYQGGQSKNMLYWPRSKKQPPFNLTSKNVWQRLKDQSSECLKYQDKLAVIGFSNGGYFVTQLFFDCPDHKVQWYMTIGSGGLSFNPKTLKKCGPIRFFTGKSDLTRNKAARFTQRLKTLSIDANHFEYPGGHHLPADLSPWFKNLKWLQ